MKLARLHPNASRVTTEGRLSVQGLGPQPANDEGGQEQGREGKHTPCDNRRIAYLVVELPNTKIPLTKRQWNNNGNVARMKTNKMSKVVMNHMLVGCVVKGRELRAVAPGTLHHDMLQMQEPKKQMVQWRR